MSPDWPRVSKNERHGYEEPEVPAAAPPPAPELVKLQELTIAGIFGWCHGHQCNDQNCVELGKLLDKYVSLHAAHLQAELDIVTKDRNEYRAEVEQQKECSRKLAQDADKVAADLRAAEARRRVLEEALRAMLAHYNQAVPPYHRNLCEICQLAERALGEAQEEK